MRTFLRLCSWAFAVGGIALGVAALAGSDSTIDTLVLVAWAVGALAWLLSAGLHRSPMWVLVASIAAVGAISVARALEVQATSVSSVSIEISLGAGTLVVVAALLTLLRRRLGSQASAVIADGLIVGLGAWIIVWVLLVQPALDANDSTGVLTVLRSATLAGVVLVVTLLAIVLFSDSAPSPSIAQFAAAIALATGGIVVRAVDLRPDVTVDRHWIDAPLIAAVMIVGAALAHPSIRSITRAGALRVAPPLMTRLTATTTSLVAPIIVLSLTDAADTRDRAVRAASAAILAIVVMARVVQSVRSNASTQDQLVKNALTDPLTGLPNRTSMLRHIDAALRTTWGTSHQPTVLFVDVDRFKNINDSLGHSMGDDVLVQVAARLAAAVPSHAIVGRIAGDEFVVLDGETETATQSVTLAESILDALREPISRGKPDLFVTASIGVAFAPRGVDLSADALMRHADTAMYRAKDAGRNCIALFDDSMVERVTQRLDIETALYRALERNEVRLVHQPIVDTELGLVVGFESLMRWQREGQSVSPVDFIPVAEDTGTIVPLGSWALRDALMQLRQWIDDGVCKPSTTISVNVSPRQLHEPQFVHIVADALSASSIPPDQLWLEVTESVMITEPTQALTALKKLTSLGVRIAIDDFGTGYSSLSLLQQFPIQAIKIDRSFVQAMDDDSTHSIVRTIVAMAQTLEADVVAEGVETREQLHTLQALGCRRAQGYFIGAPMEVAHIPEVVREIEDHEMWTQRISR